MSGWTAAQDKMLTDMWQSGLSASEISRRCTNKTRNAVIGRVHRLKLQGRKSPIVKKHQPRKLRSQKPDIAVPYNRTPRKLAKDKPPIKPLPVVAPYTPLNGSGVRFIDVLNRHCRYIAGDPKDPASTFCGHQVVAGTSWCPHHLPRMFGSQKNNDEAEQEKVAA